MQFPQYRKYRNGKSFFKIESENEFTELKYENGRWQQYQIKATILPDRNYISDMLFHFEDHWEEIEAAPYREIERQLL
jgi:hypothetical protein